MAAKAADSSKLKVIVPPFAGVELAELAGVAPNVRLVVCRSEAEAVEAVKSADASIGFASKAVLAAGKRLRWVQTESAGVDHLIDASLSRRKIQITSAKGAYAPQMAEHHLAFLLALSRNLLRFRDHQKSEHWGMAEGDALFELEGRRLLVVGFGGVGKATAERARALGMRVEAITNKKARKPAGLAERVRRPGPAPAACMAAHRMCGAGLDRIGPPAALPAFLARADAVAVCCPLTADTRGMFGEDAFRAMKRTALFTNVTRGAVVDTAALVRALEEGLIAGAGLDVVDPEPLPRGHPLWRMPNVILTPHVSGHASRAGAQLFAIIRENLRRFAAGRALVNRVDLALGY